MVSIAGQPAEEQIRELAYQIFKSEGGWDPVAHWLRAEQLIRRRLRGSNVDEAAPQRGHVKSGLKNPRG
jgi:hypothetical protein